jgi:hypothetical protein
MFWFWAHVPRGQWRLVASCAQARGQVVHSLPKVLPMRHGSSHTPQCTRSLPSHAPHATCHMAWPSWLHLYGGGLHAIGTQWKWTSGHLECAISHTVTAADTARHMRTYSSAAVTVTSLQLAHT